MTAAAMTARAGRRFTSLRELLPQGTQAIVLPVCLAGIAVVVLALSRDLGEFAGPVLGLLVAATLAEAFPVPIEGVAAGATSFANVFIAASATIYDWRAAAVVGA